jgi:hypothetical protein
VGFFADVPIKKNIKVKRCIVSCSGKPLLSGTEHNNFSFFGIKNHFKVAARSANKERQNAIKGGKKMREVRFLSRFCFFCACHRTEMCVKARSGYVIESRLGIPSNQIEGNISTCCVCLNIIFPAISIICNTSLGKKRNNK